MSEVCVCRGSIPTKLGRQRKLRKERKDDGEVVSGTIQTDGTERRKGSGVRVYSEG